MTPCQILCIVRLGRDVVSVYGQGDLGYPTAEAAVGTDGEAAGIVIEGKGEHHSGTGAFERGSGVHFVLNALVSTVSASVG